MENLINLGLDPGQRLLQCLRSPGRHGVDQVGKLRRIIDHVVHAHVDQRQTLVQERERAERTQAVRDRLQRMNDRGEVDVGEVLKAPKARIGQENALLVCYRIIWIGVVIEMLEIRNPSRNRRVRTQRQGKSKPANRNPGKPGQEASRDRRTLNHVPYVVA